MLVSGETEADEIKALWHADFSPVCSGTVTVAGEAKTTGFSVFQLIMGCFVEVNAWLSLKSVTGENTVRQQQILFNDKLCM